MQIGNPRVEMRQKSGNYRIACKDCDHHFDYNTINIDKDLANNILE